MVVIEIECFGCKKKIVSTPMEEVPKSPNAYVDFACHNCNSVFSLTMKRLKSFEEVRVIEEDE